MRNKMMPSLRDWLGLGILITLPLSPAGGEALTIDQPLSFPEIRVEPNDDGTGLRVEVPDGRVEVQVGDPAIPAVRVVIPIDRGVTVRGVDVQVLDEHVWTPAGRIAPYAGEQSLVHEEPPRAAGNPRTYAETDLFPADAARFVTIFDQPSGERFAVVVVHPVRVRPATGELHWLRQGRLQLTLESEAGGLRQLRSATTEGPGGRGFEPTPRPSLEGSGVAYAIVSPPDPDMVAEWQRLADWKTACGYPAVVRTTDWIDENYATGADQAERIRMFFRDAYTHWGLRWALLGGDVDLVPCRYARSWGHMPSNETGTDVACDYYFACLEGTWDGDQDGTFGESYRSDGQAGGPNMGDDVDFTPEIHVGRVSARTRSDVQAYLDKYFTYVQTPSTGGYLDKLTLLGEVLFDVHWSLSGRGGLPDCAGGEWCVADTCRVVDGDRVICAHTDGASDVFQIEALIEDLVDPQVELELLLERDFWWRVTPYNDRLHPEALPESKESVMGAINDGRGFVFHCGHGDRDRWAVGNGRILIGDLASLTNGSHDPPRYFWTYTINCNTAAIDYNCFGERLTLLPNRGAVAYIGSTNADYPSVARGIAREFFTYLFEQKGRTLGDAFFHSLASNTPSSQYDSHLRFLLYALLILGEPGLPVWQATPEPMDVSYQTDPPLGTGTLTVTVAATGGAAVEGARVCVQKEGEIYAVGLTDALGVAEIPFWPETEGAFTVTVTSAAHIPASSTGGVTAAGSGAALTLAELSVTDTGDAGSAGNGNGILETGETIRLRLGVENEGDAASEPITATLSVDATVPEGCVTLTDATAQIASVAAGATGVDEEAFLFQLTAVPPASVFEEGDQIPLLFDLTLESGGAVITHPVVLELSRAHLAVASNRQVPVGSARDTSYDLWVGLANNGKGTASHLEGHLAPTSGYPYAVIEGTDTQTIASIEPGSAVEVGPFRVAATNETLARLTFTVTHTLPEPDEIVYTRELGLVVPNRPDSTWAIGLPGGMDVRWRAPEISDGDGIAGYVVYRAAEGESEFTPAHEGILTEHRYLKDGGLDQLSQYRYQVAAVDSGGNRGPFSEVVSAYTSPGVTPGWPNVMEGSYYCSPLICELDGYVTSGREILFGGNLMYGFHGNGLQVSDGDGVGSTYGPFTDRGDEYWSKAAAADIDDDDHTEVLAVSFQDKKLYCWPDSGGTPDWDVTLDTRAAWHSPVIVDLDGPTAIDDRLEIIVAGGQTGSSGIFVFDHEGQPWENTGTNGLLINLGASYCYQPPAVGDVTGDGFPEIVMATREGNFSDGRLWVVRRNGSVPAAFADGILFSDLDDETHGFLGTTSSPSLADVDGDKGDEIFLVTPEWIACVDKNADVWWRYEFPEPFPNESGNTREPLPEPAIGDLDRDDQVDVVIIDQGGNLFAFRGAGDGGEAAILDGFPVALPTEGGQVYGSCILANIDADDRNPEIIFGDSNQRVHAYKYDGTVARGFPVFVGGTFTHVSPAAWDVDLDGYQNLVVQARGSVQLTVLDLNGVVFDPADNPWPMRFRDNGNTSRYLPNPPVAVQMTLEPPQVDDQGRVYLTWQAGESVLGFRVRRAGPDGRPEIDLGEVPGHTDEASRTYHFEDIPGEAGLYVYRVNPIALNGVEETGPTVAVQIGAQPASRLALYAARPNPLGPNDAATLVFTLPGKATTSPAATRLRVIDPQGRVVRQLVNEPLPGGPHTVEWDGRDGRGRVLPSGLYLLRLDAYGAVASHRMLLLQ